MVTRFALLAALLSIPVAQGQQSEPVALPVPFQTTTQIVETLASPGFEGRATGRAGAAKTVDFIAQELRNLGARPIAGADDFRLPFEFTAGMKDAGSSIAFGDVRHGAGEHLGALSFSDSDRVSAEVVFAGYGLKTPAGSDFEYDSFVGLDLGGKIALVLRYFPEEVDRDARAQLARYSGLRYKAMQARERGAVGMIVVTGPNSPNAGEVVPMSFDTAIAGSGLVAVSVSGEVGAALVAHHPDRSLASIQKDLDSGNPHIGGFAIPDLEVTLDVAVDREKRTGRNVVGVLPANAEPARGGAIVLGAHYDHLGRGAGGNSLADASERDAIHHGADDNASGVAAVLRAARQLRGRPDRTRDVVLGFWGGEELGLLGSTDFVEELDERGVEAIAYLNFDMVGRLRDEKLTVQAVGSSPVWPRLLEQANVVAGFDLHTNEDPYLPTDSQAFYLAGIPTLNFFTGSHEDYHKPSDTAEKIDVEGIDRIADFAAHVTRKLLALDAAPEHVEVARKSEGGSRDGMRAFTGTIPDYTAEVEGLLLSGVIGGGPAEAAGLRKGDVIVEFGGQEIKNIYDYTYALDAIKIDEPLEVVFLRDGERKQATITPTARK